MLALQDALSSTSKVVHISHDDLDGVSALLVSKVMLTDRNLDLRSVGNKEVDDAVQEFMASWDKETVLILTDISVSPQVAEALEVKHREGYKVFLVDHHKSALDLNQYVWADVRVAVDGILASATSLYASYFSMLPSKLQSYCELVRLFDTWDWSLIGGTLGQKAKYLNDLFYLLPRKDFEQFVLSRLKDSASSEFDFGEKEYFLLEVEQKRIEGYIKAKDKQLQIREYNHFGTKYTIGVVTVESYHSELGNTLCELHPELDFTVLLDLGRRAVSLRRGTSDIDLAEIARSFGGGGHVAAAGFPLSNESMGVFVIPYLFNGSGTR